MNSMNTMNKKYDLMKEICKFYDYEFKEENGKIICHLNEDYHYEYKNIDDALIDFYDTLIQSNENHDDYNEVNPYTTWTKDEVDFIRGVITNNTVDVVFAYSEVLDIIRNQIKLEHKFDVVITSEKDGKTTVNKMDSYCNIYIDEINNLISAEHDEDKRSSLVDMKCTMINYKYMIKDYRAELSNIGKYVRDEIKSREFYDYVDWEEFDEEVYANIGYNMSQHKEPMQQLIEYSLDIAYEYSDWTFDLITKYVDKEIEKNGYTFDDNIDRFVKEKTVESLKNLLNSNSIEYETINLTEHKEDKVAESEILKVDINCSGDYIEVSIEDGNLEYSVVEGLNKWISEDHCSLAKHLFENDDKLIDFINKIKASEDEIEEGVVASMNTLQVKYDVNLQYKGTELVGVVQCHKLECKGIPCVKDDKLELVKALYVLKGERYYIRFVEINNLIYPMTDIKYWFGITAEDLFDEIQVILQEQEVPSSYIKVSDNYYKVEKIEDILDIDTEGGIQEFEVNDRILNGMLKHYLGVEINLLVGDLESILKELDNDFDMLRSLLSFNNNLNDWVNSVDIYYYWDYELENAYRNYLEEEIKIPYSVLDYMDIDSYMEKETTVSHMECNGNVVLYC